MNKDIATIVHNQLNTLMHSPSTISRYSILETPTDQYEAFNILTSAWGRSGEHVGFRAMADNINQLACLSLPREPDDPEPSITTAIDHIDNQEYDAIEND
ncbi:1847_t:CDS:2, partial [Racocetra fulgida]